SAPPQSYAGPAESSRAHDRQWRRGADRGSRAGSARAQALAYTKWRLPAPKRRSCGREESHFDRRQRETPLRKSLSQACHHVADDRLDGKSLSALEGAYPVVI